MSFNEGWGVPIRSEKQHYYRDGAANAACGTAEYARFRIDVPWPTVSVCKRCHVKSPIDMPNDRAASDDDDDGGKAAGDAK